MIGVVVLNYNTWDDCLKCINSMECASRREYKVYLVDNNSSIQDKNIISILENKNNVELIFNKDNKGYARGNNIGIMKALSDNCEYIMIANPDVIFLNNSIDYLVDFYEVNTNIGMIGPKIFYPNGKTDETKVQEKITYNLRWKTQTILRLFHKKLEKKVFGLNKKGEIIECYTLPGCCLLFSNESIKTVNLFDERTFLYEEENILGDKMKKYNFKVFQISKAKVIHHHGASTKNIKMFSYICFIESELYYCKYYCNSSKKELKRLYNFRKFTYFVKTLFKKSFIKKYRTFIRECNTKCSSFFVD